MQFSFLSANTIAALAFALTAIGIIIQILAGVVSAKVPVGAIVLMVIAIFTIVKAWPWIPAVGVVASVGILIGALVVGGVITRLGNPDHFAPFIGTALQFLGIGVGIVAGILAVVANYSK